MKNKRKIIEGIKNSLNLEHLPEEVKEVILERRIICAGCPFMSENATTSDEYHSLSGEHYRSFRSDPHCAMCGCPIQYKTASLSSSCGMEAWNEQFPEKAQPLKWVNTQVVNQDEKERPQR